MARYRVSESLPVLVLWLFVLSTRFWIWGDSIWQFQQDEVEWHRDFQVMKFREYLITPDAGYPTPGLRLLSGILFSILDKPLFVHLVLIFVATMCLMFPLLHRSGVDSFKNQVGVVAALTSFGSFDLLLLHNLPYLFAIPLMTILLTSHHDFRGRQIAIFSLALVSAKPQILLVVFIVMLFEVSALAQNRSINRKRLVSRLPTLAILGTLMVLGRLTDTALTFNPAQLQTPYALLLSPFIVVSQLIPFSPLLLSLIRYLEFSDFGLVPHAMWTWFILTAGLFGILLTVVQSRLKVLTIAMAAVIPLMASTSSGWSVYLPTTFGYYPLIHQRHDFFVLTLMLIICSQLFDVMTKTNPKYSHHASIALGVCTLQHVTIAIIFRQYGVF